MLVDRWAAQLTGTDFKVTAWLYHIIARNGGNPVSLPARQLAESTGISQRAAESARKTLADQGIIRVQRDGQGNYYALPEAAIQDDGEPDPTEAAAHSLSSCDAPQDGGTADVAAAEKGITNGPAINAERVAVEEPANMEECGTTNRAAPENGIANGPATSERVAVEEPASMEECGTANLAAPDGSIANGPAFNADQVALEEPANMEECGTAKIAAPEKGIANGPATNAERVAVEEPANVGECGTAKTAAPEAEAPAIANLAEAWPLAVSAAPQESAGAAVPIEPAPATSEAGTATANTATAISRGSGPAQPAEPVVGSGEKATIDDKMRAVLRHLVPDIPPGTDRLDDVQWLREKVNDDELVLACMHWLRRKGNTYDTTTLLGADLDYYCFTDGWAMAVAVPRRAPASEGRCRAQK